MKADCAHRATASASPHVLWRLLEKRLWKTVYQCRHTSAAWVLLPKSSIASTLVSTAGVSRVQ